jgi:O-antigen/teichoic acid export membrane protein
VTGWVRRFSKIPAVRDHGDAVLYTGSSVFKSVVSFASGLILVRFVEPAELGLWNSVGLAATYVLFLQAGVISGLSRELPFHLGSRDLKKAEDLSGTAQTFTFAGMAVCALAGLVSCGLYWKSSLALRLAILAVAGGAVCTFYQNYLTVTFRSKSSFRNLAGAQALGSVLALATLPMLALWKYEGMLARSVLVIAATVGMMHMVRPIRVPTTWNWGAFRLLMTTGLPIFALSYLESATGTTDRVVLLKWGGVESVGYYSLALMVQGAVSMIPVSLASYIYPRMTFSYGQDKDRLALWRTALRTTVALLAVMAPLVVVGWFLLPILVIHFFPKYEPGILAAQITLLAGLFSGGTIGSNAIWSLKAWSYMTAYQVIGSALRVLGPLAGAWIAQDALAGVASGLLGAHVILFALSLFMTYRVTHKTLRAP